MSERSDKDKLGEVWAEIMDGPLMSWPAQTEDYRALAIQEAGDKLLPQLIAVGLDPASIRAAERECCAKIADLDEFTFTGDINTARRIASRIRARSASDGREG